jgi:hypothetical protein
VRATHVGSSIRDMVGCYLGGCGEVLMSVLSDTTFCPLMQFRKSIMEHSTQVAVITAMRKYIDSDTHTVQLY